MIIRNAVPIELVDAAREKLLAEQEKSSADSHVGGRRYQDEALETSREFTDLVNKSDLGEVIRNTMGPYDSPTRGFAATVMPTDVDDPHAGKAQRPVPGLHLDGLYGGPVPHNDGLRENGYIGPHSSSTLANNRGVMFIDEEKTLAMGHFTAFVGVSLCDQTEPGRGQFSVLPRAHHVTEKFFQAQRAAGGPIGPEGPGWPRVSPFADPSRGFYMNLFPDPIREAFPQNAERNADGRLVPEARLVLLAPGDAVIALQHTPHSSTLNTSPLGPRWQIYFRLRHQKFNNAFVPPAEHETPLVTGRSDHPDRGWDGEYLPTKPGATPWEDAIDALCDCWSEWDGMKKTVEMMRVEEAAPVQAPGAKL